MDPILILVVGLVLLAAVGGVALARRRHADEDLSLGSPRGTTDLETPSVPSEAVAEAPPVGRRSLAERLGRSRRAFTDALRSALGRGADAQTWDALEEALIGADVGVAAATDIVAEVRERAEARGAREAGELRALLREVLVEAFDGDRDRALRLEHRPAVVLVVGVNGVGKTTTIAKLAARLREDGRTPLLAAADTFRAAADAQLRTWADRVRVDVVAGQAGADPAAVAYDAYQAARARGADVVLVDTAGRLHSKRNLMDELSKIRRVLEREAGAIDEVLLVLDATTGQNGIAQARSFTDAVGVTGIVLTKLDGTAKGGIVVAVERELGVPVRYIGVGEGIDDLLPFDPKAFVDALLEDTP